MKKPRGPSKIIALDGEADKSANTNLAHNHFRLPRIALPLNHLIETIFVTYASLANLPLSVSSRRQESMDLFGSVLVYGFKAKLLAKFNLIGFTVQYVADNEFNFSFLVID